VSASLMIVARPLVALTIVTALQTSAEHVPPKQLLPHFPQFVPLDMVSTQLPEQSVIVQGISVCASLTSLVIASVDGPSCDESVEGASVCAWRS
jgi:hypothetical protein